MTGSLFQHGIGSGDPTPRRVVLWTRVTVPEGRTPTAAFWRVIEAETGRLVANGQTRVRTEADSSIRVDVSGLRPDTRYLYDFEVDGEPSPQGRTRTLPEEDVSTLRFAQVSCAKYNAGHFNAYARLAERDDIAFVLHLGDWIYEASQMPPASQTASKDIGRPFDPPHECRTLDDYRRRYAQYRRDPDVQAVSAAHPFISTVDDHEFADGAWRDGATEHRPERDGPWAARKAAAFQAREEWLPVRRPEMAKPERVYRSVPIGGLAELFLLDTRTIRDQPIPPPGLSRKDRTNLGPEQKAWLFDALRSSRARWRLIGNPSVMARTWNDSLPDFVRQALVKVKLIDADGTGPDYDQWDGYPVERREVLDFIGKLPESNVVVLSGDVHVAIAAELAETPSEPPVAVEFVNSSLTSQNLDDKMGWGYRTESRTVEEALLAGMPHMQHIELDSHGYSIVDVDRDRVRFEWWNVEALETRAPGEAMAASMWVRHGVPRLIADGATEPRATPPAAKPARRTGVTRKPATAKLVAAKPGTAKRGTKVAAAKPSAAATKPGAASTKAGTVTPNPRSAKPKPGPAAPESGAATPKPAASRAARPQTTRKRPTP